jgi:hypothetical protein
MRCLFHKPVRKSRKREQDIVFCRVRRRQPCAVDERFLCGFLLSCAFPAVTMSSGILKKSCRERDRKRTIMNTILLGNIVAFAGAILMVLVGLMKKKRDMLLLQNVQFLVMGIGNLILGGITGGIADFISIARNFICLKWKIFFVAVQAALTAVCNQDGIIGWLPVIAAIAFTWALDSENEVLLKSIIIAAQLMWLIYDLHFLNFASAAFDVLTCISNFVGIILVIRSRSRERKA